MAHAWLISCQCVLQTSVADERAERTHTTPTGQDDVHFSEANGDSDAKHAQPHSKENGSASAQQDSSTAAGAEQKSTELPSTVAVNGLDLHPAPQPEQHRDAEADSASGAKHEKEPPLSGKEREVMDASGGEEKGGFKFSKGAYFIGKAVWGKVHHSPALPPYAIAMPLKSGCAILPPQGLRGKLMIGVRGSDLGGCKETMRVVGMPSAGPDKVPVAPMGALVSRRSSQVLSSTS